MNQSNAREREDNTLNLGIDKTERHLGVIQTGYKGLSLKVLNRPKFIAIPRVKRLVAFHPCMTLRYPYMRVWIRRKSPYLSDVRLRLPIK